MQDFLRRIRLLRDFSVELPLSVQAFEQAFGEQVEVGKLTYVSAYADVFRKSDKRYFGELGNGTFHVRRLQRLFDFNPNWSSIRGAYSQADIGLSVHGEVNAFHPLIALFYIMALSLYLLLIILMLNGVFGNGEMAWFGAFLVLHGALLFGLPYLVMRRASRKMVEEIERRLKNL